MTVKQLAYLEPTLVEVVACMIGDLLNEALRETVDTVGVPEAAARAMLFGHIQVALANGLRGDNPFSDACLIAMDYGRNKIIKDDWRSIFDDDELDHVLNADAAPGPDPPLILLDGAALTSQPGHSDFQDPGRSPHDSLHDLCQPLILGPGERVAELRKCSFTREYRHAVSLLIMVCF